MAGEARFIGETKAVLRGLEQMLRNPLFSVTGRHFALEYVNKRHSTFRMTSVLTKGNMNVPVDRKIGQTVEIIYCL